MLLHPVDIKPEHWYRPRSKRGRCRLVTHIHPVNFTVTFKPITDGSGRVDRRLNDMVSCSMPEFLAWAADGSGRHFLDTEYDVFIVPGAPHERTPDKRGTYIGALWAKSEAEAVELARKYWPETYTAFNFDNHLFVMEIGV